MYEQRHDDLGNLMQDYGGKLFPVRFCFILVDITRKSVLP